MAAPNNSLQNTAEVDSEGEERLTTSRRALKSNHMEEIGSVPPPVTNFSDVALHHDPEAHAKPTQPHCSPRSENKDLEMHTNTQTTTQPGADLNESIHHAGEF